MLNVGLVGVGGISRAHLPAYAGSGAGRLVALCDTIPERARGEGKILINIETEGGVGVQAKAYTDYHEFLADPLIEVVDICLPTYLHAEVAIAALNAGKHVLTEKPMALSVEECDRMIAAAEANKRFLMVAQCLRFWPEYTALKGLVDSGQYGKLLSATFRRMGGMPAWGVRGWFHDPALSGGCILDLHIHDADYLTYLLGMPARVTTWGTENALGINQMCSHYDYENGAVVFVDSAWCLNPKAPFHSPFFVTLEQATVELDGTHPMTVYPNEGEPLPLELPAGNAYINEINYFLDCVARGVQPTVVSAWDARESVRLIMAEKESLRSGKTVAL